MSDERKKICDIKTHKLSTQIGELVTNFSFNLASASCVDLEKQLEGCNNCSLSRD